MKKLFTLFFMMLLPLMSSADAVKIDGIYYNLDDDRKTAEVSSYVNYSYEINYSCTIPKIVVYNDIEYSITSIGESAFSGCKGLTSVKIPNSVTSIGKYAFYNCSSLVSVTIPNSVFIIDVFAFSGCSALTSITIPNSVISISGNVFSDCSSLSIVVIPNSVETIGSGAFSGCCSLSSVTIPNTVNFIDREAFEGCISLSSIVVEEGNAVYDSRNNCNAIIVTAKDSLVIGCYNTIIPNSVASIGSRAFSDCSGQTSISIPNSVISISGDSFCGCSGIMVEEGNPKYDSRNNCNAVIETASNSLIAGCKNTIIPYSVTSIGDYAFSGCTGLTSITIPNSVTSIGDCAFNRCSGLASVIIPNSVTTIGQSAFQYCRSLTSVTLGNSVKSIGGATFWECINMHDIYCYTENKPSIGPYAFYHYVYVNFSSAEKDSYDVRWHVPADYINNYESSYKTDVVAIEDTYTLKYLVDGEEYKSAKIYEGAPITPEPAPTKEGYIFSGWSKIPETMPAKDVTITGTFVQQTDEDEIKITSAGQTTWCSAYDLDFTDIEGLKAYMAEGYNRTTGTIWLMRVFEVPAGEGILLIGDAGDYTIPHKSTTTYYMNMLVGTVTAKTINETDGEYTNYYLSSGDYGVGFYKVNGSVDLKANRAYLPLLKSTVSGSRGFIGIDFDDGEDGTTGISEAQQRVGEQDVWYNLQGQRVDNPSKGLYIRNGKKVIVK